MKVWVLGVDLRAVSGRDLADLLGEEHSPNDPLRYNEDWGRRQGRTPSWMQALHKRPALNMIHASFKCELCTPPHSAMCVCV